MKQLFDPDVEELLDRYREVFGDTFSILSVPPGRVNYLVEAMRLALEGRRGAITDRELGVDLPPDACS